MWGGGGGLTKNDLEGITRIYSKVHCSEMLQELRNALSRKESRVSSKGLGFLNRKLLLFPCYLAGA